MSQHSTTWSGPDARQPVSWARSSGSAPRRSAWGTGSSSRRTSGCRPQTSALRPSGFGSATARSAPWWRSFLRETWRQRTTLSPGRVTFPEPRVTLLLTLLPASRTRPRAEPERGRSSSSSMTGGKPFSPAATPKAPPAWDMPSPCSVPRGSPWTTPSVSVATASTRRPATPSCPGAGCRTTSTSPPRRTRGGRSATTPTTSPSATPSSPSSTPCPRTGNRPWPGTRLPTWPTVTSEDLDAAFREHATLGQWIADHAPADVTRQLADAYLRPLDTSSAEQSRSGADDDVKTLLAAQRRREAWVSRSPHRDRDLVPAGPGPPASRVPARPSRRLQPTGPHDGSPGPPSRAHHRCRTVAVRGRRHRGLPRADGASTARTRSDPNLSTPNSVPTGRGQSGSSSRLASRRQEAPRASSTSYGSRHSGIGCTPSMPHGRRRASDATRDVTPLPQPPPFSWSRDSDSGRDLGDGFGL